MPLLNNPQRGTEAAQRQAQVQTRLLARQEEKDDRRPRVVLAPTQPASVLSPELASQPIEQQTLASGGLLQGGQQAAGQAEAPSAVSQIGQLAISQLGKQAAGAGLKQLGLPGFSDLAASFGTTLAGSGLGGGLSIVPGAGFGTAAGGAAAAAGVAPVAGGLSNAAATGAATAAGSAALAPIGLTAAIFLNNLTKGTPDNVSTTIGIDPKSGRPRVTDADAKGGPNSRDAAAFGQTAISALDKVRRELGGTFNRDIGDFGTFGGKPGSIFVSDAGIFENKISPAGLFGKFATQKDAEDAFVIGALRSGVVKGDQDKINAKIRELAPVFERERLIGEQRETNLLGPAANEFQSFTAPLNPFLQGVRDTGDIPSLMSGTIQTPEQRAFGNNGIQQQRPVLFNASPL